MSCTSYIRDDADAGGSPCHCPVCGGFLKWKYFEDKPICNKCHTPLEIIPEKDEETGEEQDWGKICVITKHCEGCS